MNCSTFFDKKILMEFMVNCDARSEKLALLSMQKSAKVWPVLPDGQS